MNPKGNILIVDDERVMREIMEGVLINQGYHLEFAEGGNEALAKAADLTPDLILLDVMMPDKDGFEVCQRLRSTPALAEVPVLMVTALDDRESRLKGIKVGADDFITKPFDAAEMQTRVQTIVRLNRFRRLLAERSKFRWVVEQAEDGFLILSEETEIVYANTQARLYLDLPADPDEVIGETFIDIVKRHYHCEPQAVWAAWPGQATDQAPLYLVRPESAIADAFWLQVDLMEMAAEANERYLVSLRDVTENVLVRRVMWTFHDQVGHKLKTPLTLLTGFLEILKEDPAALNEEETRSILTKAHKNAHRLQAEVLRIFDFMQGSDTAKLGLAHFCLAAIPEMLERIKTDLELETVELYPADLANQSDTYLPISNQSIEQILRELLRNAKKFHPQQVPNIEIRISRVEQGVRFQICDDGQILSPDQLAKMWTPYYQAEKFFSGQIPGMGLGLATIAGMIWSIGGTCTAYNRTNEPGLVIELVIPTQNDDPAP
jgi:two-component system cell cycle response regulator